MDSESKKIYNYVLNIYPFLSTKDRKEFIENSKEIIEKDKIDFLKIKNILKLLKRDNHASVKKNNKKRSKRKKSFEAKNVIKSEILDRILILTIPSWSNKIKNLDTILIELCVKNEKRYDSIIVDVRKNSGGDSFIAHNFAGIFFERDVEYGTLKKMHKNKIKEYKAVLKHNEKIFINKRIIILISEKCYSSNELFLAPFKITDRAVLIGESTRGGSANSQTIETKNFTIRIPRWYFFLKGEKTPIEETKIQPDIFYNKRNIVQFAKKYIKKHENKNSRHSKSEIK